MDGLAAFYRIKSIKSLNSDNTVHIKRVKRKNTETVPELVPTGDDASGATVPQIAIP